MSLDFRNLNTLWASVMAETLVRLGLQTAVICPGSRSAPLAIALARHPQLDAIPVLDERSASFFALGLAKRTHRPVALICTSGTAGANFYPAVIEASESGVPLIVLTADRPPELRQCKAGQAIDQSKLFGHYPVWQLELALPETDRLRHLLPYLRQTLVQAWGRSQFPHPGPVHLNVPLREPLAPIAAADQSDLSDVIDAETFFAHVAPAAPARPGGDPLPDWHLFQQLQQQYPRGLIIAGLAQPQEAEVYCRAIATLATTLGWPVLADALNPLRNFQALNPNLIGHYDEILRSQAQASLPDLQPDLQPDLRPDGVIRIGELPTSRVLRQWLTGFEGPQWVISDRPDNLDPLHGHTIHLRLGLNNLAETPPTAGRTAARPGRDYLQRWQRLEEQVTEAIAQRFRQTPELREPKIAWFLSQHLPVGTLLFVANSTPVRDLEWFWQKGDRHIQPYVNRGANGIDGTLSTALGLAHRSQRPCVLLTGDLALLHDTNGFLLAKTLSKLHPADSLTIVLINNNGGGIFELLPISQFEPPFEEFFATPQNIAFAQLCKTYDIEHHVIVSWEALAQQLKQLPLSGVRLLEIRSDRKADAGWRSQLLSELMPRQ